MQRPLPTLTQAALGQHGQAPQAAADRLVAAQCLLAEAEGPEIDTWLRAAEHVLLGHLAQPAWLQACLEAATAQLPRHPPLRPALQRVAAALALATGRPPLLDDLPPAEQLRAHYNALLAATRQPVLDAARPLWRQVLSLASPWAQEPAAQRALGALCDNLASDLRERPGPTEPAALALMIEAATEARAAWQRCGGWLEIERADWQLAMCLAHAGDGTAALRHAHAGLAACQAHGADDYECCFAWQALAHAALAAQDKSLAQQARDEMARRQALLSDADDRAYAQACLAWIDARLG